MAKEIQIQDLIAELRENLNKVHNLKKVYVGKSSQTKLEEETTNRFIEPHSKQIIAYGEPDVIEKGLKEIVDSLSKDFLIERKDKVQNGNGLFVVLDIDTSHNYSIDDLDDEDLLADQYALIK